MPQVTTTLTPAGTVISRKYFRLKDYQLFSLKFRHLYN